MKKDASSGAQYKPWAMIIFMIFMLYVIMLLLMFNCLLTRNYQQQAANVQPGTNSMQNKNAAGNVDVVDMSGKRNADKVLAEGKVREILVEFAIAKGIVPDISDEDVLIDVLNSHDNMAERIDAAETDLKKAELEDAPDMRTAFSSSVKICVAKSILNDTMKNTCDLSDPLKIKFDKESDIDDITGFETILPYFLNGVAYYEDGDYKNAKPFLEKVKEHRQAGIARWNDQNFPLGNQTYKKMYDETLRILSDKRFSA